MFEFVPLALRPVTSFDPALLDASPGRRLRVFAALIKRSPDDYILLPTSQPEGAVVKSPSLRRGTNYKQLLRMIEKRPCGALYRLFVRFPLRVVYTDKITSLSEIVPDRIRDPDLHPALQDLADEINEDIHEALGALDNPNYWYPGIDTGIELVPDDHVELVIRALQRELDRELRTITKDSKPLPAAPLSELPWSIQRALVERRRWRYKQFGIGRSEWETNTWSLWNIPKDPDFVPRRALRLIPT